MAKYKVFYGSTMHRGQQIYLELYATSIKEAVTLLHSYGETTITPSHVQTYFSYFKKDKLFNGIMAYIDGGYYQKELKDIMRKPMQLDKLKNTISEIANKKYANPQKSYNT